MSNCYRKPYLQKVIARINFTAKYQLPQKGLSKKVSDTVLNIFPIPEPRQVLAKQVQISSSGTTENHEKQNHLFYHGKSRDKTLCITPDFLYVEIIKYQTYEQLKEEFCAILDKLNEAEEFSVNRFGLRYINNIDLNEEEPLNWEKYINNELLHMFNVTGDKKNLSRVFSNIVQHFEDGMQLNFNYGMHNPDFPSRIKRKSFIMDLDAFFQGVLKNDDVKSGIDIAHDRIEKLFERCIKDDLREAMKIEKHE